MVRYAKGNPDWFPVSKGDMHSVVSGGFHYILNGNGVAELYDFNDDVWEQDDLAKLPEYRHRLDAFHTYIDEVLQGSSKKKGSGD